MSAGFPRAEPCGLIGCQTCGLVVKFSKERELLCPRCNSKLRLRKYHSIQRTWALLISAIFMYIPANTETVMYTVNVGEKTSDTIISGIIFFFESGEWPLAIIIFLASVLLPLLKIILMIYLLYTVGNRKADRRAENTRLYRIAELVGRWSMLDIFVIAILVALVQLDALTTIIPGNGAIAFAAVVILTMLAVKSFDPRLLWDTPK